MALAGPCALDLIRFLTNRFVVQNPEAFTRLGIQPPKGILLYGPPVRIDLGLPDGSLSTLLVSHGMAGLQQDADGESAGQRVLAQLHCRQGTRGSISQLPAGCW